MEGHRATLQKTLAYVAAEKKAACKRYRYDASVPVSRGRCTSFRVENRDAIEVALVMILADAHAPGGCIFGGGNMQEESLFLRTALFAHLKKDEHYPIAPDEALYARDVTVYFDTAARGYGVQVAVEEGHTHLVAGALGRGRVGLPAGARG